MIRGQRVASAEPDRPADATPAADRQFVLLLLEPVSEPLDAQEEAARVSDYRDWAGRLGAEGRLLAGEKLKDVPATVGGTGQTPTRAPDERITGYFILRAGSLQEALVLARDCPHAVHGNRIQVREIDPT